MNETTIDWNSVSAKLTVFLLSNGLDPRIVLSEDEMAVESRALNFEAMGKGSVAMRLAFQLSMVNDAYINVSDLKSLSNNKNTGPQYQRFRNSLQAAGFVLGKGVWRVGDGTQRIVFDENKNPVAD